VVLRWFILLGSVMLFLGLLLIIVVCLNARSKSKSSFFLVPVGMASIGMALGLSL
jgi:hypothetical protein